MGFALWLSLVVFLVADLRLGFYVYMCDSLLLSGCSFLFVGSVFACVLFIL